MNTYTTVETFLSDLSPERRSQVTTICEIIREAAPELSEHIKWNSPSYVVNGEDRITLNTHLADKIIVIIHMGAKRKENKKGLPIMNDGSGLITWSSDIRGAISFRSLDDIEAKREAFSTIIRRWLAIEV